jgi:hypothetical protein
MSKQKSTDKTLTVQVHHEQLNPRTFRVPVRWIHQASWLAWGLLGLSAVSSIYAVKEYYSERSARPELVKELENEIQELKIALERKAIAPVATTATNPTNSNIVDSNASDQKPPSAPGETIEGRDGVWAGLAENITLPNGTASPIRLEDARIDWQGKYANFTLNLVYKDPGKGSQQGHLVVLGRGNDRLFAHPEGVLNAASGNYLFTPDRGEYFSVARFRVLKARLGPFDNSKQLTEIQVFLFDLDHKLIATQNFHYGNK